jgi:glutamate---cysteine ligase / carboxylate-amine ligase
MNRSRPLHLFQGFGIELEYMIVHRDTLAILPLADHLLTDRRGRPTRERICGPLRWSNELALHVLELKTNGPVATLGGLAGQFGAAVAEVNRELAGLDACLMPTAMHPWMVPHAEARLWPHGDKAIYQAYHRIFDCRGHGWTNLQSCHLNLPFLGDEEFGRLHAAVRLILPILPALAASSPFVEGRFSTALDTRLLVYQHNQKRLPLIAGAIIPEAVFTRRDYHRRILQPMYRAIAPFDEERLLRHEWLNSRGAIARFQRSAIEIRLLDVQECPLADQAILTAVAAVLRALVEERWQPLSVQKAWPVPPLTTILARTIHQGEQARLEDPAYLAAFGFPAPAGTAGGLWSHLIDTLAREHPEDFHEVRKPLRVMQEQGPLARRLLNAIGEHPDPAGLRTAYGELCTCLAANRLFAAPFGTPRQPGGPAQANHQPPTRIET